MLQKYLHAISQRNNLSYEEALDLSITLIAPGHSSAVVGALLASLRTKGECADEISGFVSGLKQNAVKIPVKQGEIYDVAGTGGDGAHTQNISTLTALILAGAGLTIAKHGNRSVSSRCGSADVLYEAGVNIHATPDNIALQLQECSLCFIYAPLAHPSMKNVMEVRKSLGIPSIFNLAGPLSNPVTLTGQIVGVYSPKLMDRMATVLLKLGMKRGAVIHGHGGLDEASLSGLNSVLFIEDDRLIPAQISGKDLGLKSAPISDLRGGSPSENSKALMAVLNGQSGAFRDSALLNSAIALYGFGKSETLGQALQAARESLDSGSALDKLNQLIAVSNLREAI